MAPEPGRALDCGVEICGRGDHYEHAPSVHAAPRCSDVSPFILRAAAPWCSLKPLSGLRKLRMARNSAPATEYAAMIAAEFQALLDAAVDAIVVIDEQARILTF